jgi:hypothetical protein
MSRSRPRCLAPRGRRSWPLLRLPCSRRIVRLPGMTAKGPYPRPRPFGGMGMTVDGTGFSDYFPITNAFTEVESLSRGRPGGPGAARRRPIRTADHRGLRPLAAQRDRLVNGDLGTAGCPDGVRSGRATQCAGVRSGRRATLTVGVDDGPVLWLCGQPSPIAGSEAPSLRVRAASAVSCKRSENPTPNDGSGSSFAGCTTDTSSLAVTGGGGSSHEQIAESVAPPRAIPDGATAGTGAM